MREHTTHVCGGRLALEEAVDDALPLLLELLLLTLVVFPDEVGLDRQVHVRILSATWRDGAKDM